MKKLLVGSLLALSTLSANAADYVIDTKGAHAFIEFKIKHLGYSWLSGRFNRFDGNFSYDADKLAASKITVNIDPASIDSNHAERDKHLRGDDFLAVKKFAQSSFVSTKITPLENGKMTITGNFTLHGVTRTIDIDAEKIGEGKDPWGGYRAGFSGTTEIALKDYGIDYNLGPASTQVLITLHIEGIKQ